MRFSVLGSRFLLRHQPATACKGTNNLITDNKKYDFFCFSAIEHSSRHHRLAKQSRALMWRMQHLQRCQNDKMMALNAKNNSLRQENRSSAVTSLWICPL